MKVKVGLIGVGGIAQVHLKNLSGNDQVELVAVCDVAEENAKKSALQYGAVPYTDFHEMLEKETLDALFICVPPFAHGEIEEKAASRGIHLFVEKPVGLDMETVRKKAAVIRESGVITGTGYCLRYLDTVKKAKEFLADKEIAMVRAYYLTSFVSTPWWRDIDKSGGQLVEQTTHTVDLVRYFAGDVKKVYATMDLRVMKDISGINIPDVGCVNVVFESGAIGHIDTTFIQPDHRSGLEILGRDFRVWIDGTTLTITEKDKTVTYKSGVDFYKEQDDAFIKAIRTGNRDHILAPYEEALQTLEVTLAANESAETGVPIILIS
jgi:predicted dehydrogenase